MKKISLIIFSFLISLSCERPESSINMPNKGLPETITQGGISLEEAKNYFTNTVLGSSASARIASERKYQRDIDWNSAKKVKQANGLEVIVAPVRYKTNSRPGVIFWNDKTSDDKKRPKIENALDAKECLLTFKDKSGNIQTQLVQYVSTKEYKQQKKGGISKDDFTGWVIAITWDEQPIIGYEFKNGKDVKQLTPANSGSNPGGRLAYCEFSYYQSIAVSCYPCGSNCTACDVGVSGGYQGYCTNPSSNSGTDPYTGVSYGGEGIYYYTPPTTTVDIIITNLQNPCMISAYNSLVQTQFKSKVIDIIKGFQVSKTATIDLVDRNLNNPNTDGETRVTNAAYNVYEIALNSGVLVNSSKDYIAATIIHEMLHVYLPANDGITDHEVMASKYVNPMADALKAAGYALTYNDAVALSWGGLQKTKAWQQLVDIDRVSGSSVTNQILQTNNNYRNATGYGVRCN